MTNIMAGDLRHRLTIEKRNRTTGHRGEYIDNWEPVGRMYAKITPLWGQELEVARRRQENVSVRVITRTQKARSLDSSYRLKFRSTVYNIGFIQEGNDEEMEDIHLMCSRAE